MTGRDSNRGGCAQICRWVFNKDDEYPYTLMSKDLNYMHYIKDMIDAGVNTFKIEGRMRSIYYISTVILCYRRVIDKIYNNTLTLEDEKYYLKVLNRVANRESAPQFFNRMPDENDEYYDLGGEESNQDFLGIILDYNKNTKIATIEERNYFKKGDSIEIIGPNHETFSTKINIIYDEEDNVIEVANRPRMIVKIPLNLEVEKFDLVRIKFDIDK
jgi:putative protease